MIVRKRLPNNSELLLPRHKRKRAHSRKVLQQLVIQEQGRAQAAVLHFLLQQINMEVWRKRMRRVCWNYVFLSGTSQKTGWACFCYRHGCGKKQSWLGRFFADISCVARWWALFHNKGLNDSYDVIIQATIDGKGHFLLFAFSSKSLIL